ncbi:MAG TPA: 4Fe-4S binding protein [Candidatus Limnocylindrales bacterium]|nr:4Fe-4S binding protein [Candidatus Limnocylindrales bacterium]
MLKIFHFGPSKKIVRTAVRLSWPIIKAGKKWSALPILRWIINPFFAYPYNEVTSIPINVKVPVPESRSIPQQVVQRILTMASEIFILDECICRGRLKCDHYPRNIGCIALGKSVARMHPSHGRFVTHEEAFAYVQKAADVGLIANIAHVWIDPLAFGLTNFNKLMFICFCDDCCCLYRTYMKRRGPNLDRAYKRLPGISITGDAQKCSGCGLCAKKCFVAAILMQDGKMVIGNDCRGCGRCVEICPQKALSLNLDDEETLYARIKERIEDLADIS